VTKVVLVSALAAASAGCAMFGGTPKSTFKPLDVSAYYPLAVGNSWTYSANMLGDKVEKTVSIVKEDFGYFVDDNKGRLKVDAYGLRDDKRYLLRVPLEVGTKWTTIVSVQSKERSQILETDEPCTVPAGAFEHCLTVEHRNRQDETHDLVMRMTFAPHVGIARIQVAMDAGGQLTPQSEMQLVAYRVAPPPPPAGARP
jgi:hypothetical protein